MAGLKDLVVFDQLRVYDLKVEPKRISAVYGVLKKDGSIVRNVLMYSYPQPFFNPDSRSDVNLASLMVAQVAINYGLFCRELVFEGLYDAADRRLIEDMIENTSREIYVNKFLFPNEFLVPEFLNMRAERAERYSAASLRFEGPPYHSDKERDPGIKPAADKYAILSSGGKDSLLSYGLLDEIGEAHPIFVNESGRHWYTAFNAFHQFDKFEKNTLRVWCNSDRIFNWMVRQMPFIRENFQNIRADIYPIRLWTVAVFLFGVLPVARKRGIVNIIIGNEYDTTIQVQHEGITHYAALYDQSRYFDNAFTRYYHRKGWAMVQFSLLRSLSELLILKTLVERYPHLQAHQVSCHAAHKEGERMMPCGKCEKCRRIVGMLKVLDADPANCGYLPHQIEQGLRNLENKTVKQIGSDARHLYYLLLGKGLVRDLPQVRKMAKAHNEIMSLRFDKERSRMEDLPLYIRRPLLEVLMAHADGVVRRENRKWKNIQVEELDFNSSYFLNKKYDK